MLQSLRTTLGDLGRRVARRLLAEDIGQLRGADERLDGRLAAIEGRLSPDSLISLGEQAAAAAPFVADDRLGFVEDPVAGRGWGFESAPVPETGAADFVDVFRGDEDRVRAMAAPYVAMLAASAPVLDLGCGRGELLDLLAERRVACSGVDADAAMVERARAKGHEVSQADLVEHVCSLPNGSVGGAVALHAVEHLPIERLEELLTAVHEKLRGDGIFVMETVNPFSPSGMRTFWIDPTHRTPLFPEALVVLCRAAGFARAVAYDPRGTGDFERDRFTASAYAVIARR